MANVHKIDFQYTPTYPDLDISPEYVESNDKMFVLGDPGIFPEDFLYPKISHT